MNYLFISFTLLILFVKHGETFNCRQGEDQFPKENGCILAVNEPTFYMNAARHCASLGGWMIKIRNGYENAYLAVVIQMEIDGATPYIGVERIGDNAWSYSDGSPLTYQNWAPGEPSMASNCSLCAIIDPQSGKWLTSECGINRPFYCSFDGDEFQCPDGWAYSNETDYCYYLQNFTYLDGTLWNLFNFSMAEGNCRRMNSHLVSIHSTIEDEFVYEMIYSNVINETNAVPAHDPCSRQWAWIGLIGSGEVGNGTWTDGTPVDYIGELLASRDPSWNYWIMTNDVPCQGGKRWMATLATRVFARYICKQPSAGRIRRERTEI